MLFRSRFSAVFLLHAPAPTPYSAVFLLHAPAPAPIKIGCGLVRYGSCGLVGCVGEAYTPRHHCLYVDPMEALTRLRQSFVKAFHIMFGITAYMMTQWKL